MKKLLLISMIISVFFNSCKKNISDDVNVSGIPKFAPAPVTGSVAGKIIDENDMPIANATVKVGPSTYTTNNQGIFITPSMTLDKYISTVKVTMPGYFTAYRSFSANPTLNYVTIKLTPKILAGTLSATSASSLNLPDGSTISFQANAFKIKSSGTNYSGAVKFYAAIIDPTSNDYGVKGTGSEMAEDENSFYVLKTKGILIAEPESESGEPLQLISGKPATMKFQIPASLQSTAPTTVNTWTLDERGIWIKEGTAIRNGNLYESDITHFSFWVWAPTANPIYLSLNVKDQSGNNLDNIYVYLHTMNNSNGASGWTDAQGNLSGMFPENETFGMQLYTSYTCGVPFHIQTIGPFSTDASLNIIAQTPPVTSIWTFSGSAIDCNGAPVQNGSIYLNTGYGYYFVDFSNGSYSIPIWSCSPITTVTYYIIDHTAQQQSAMLTANASGQVINTGVVTVCTTSSTEFINYTFDGTNYSISSLTPGAYLYSNIYNNITFLYIDDPANSKNVSFGLTGTDIGTFPATDTVRIHNMWGLVQPGASGSFTVYGSIGQFLEGNFNIPFGSGGSVHSLSGTFRIRRD